MECLEELKKENQQLKNKIKEKDEYINLLEKKLEHYNKGGRPKKLTEEEKTMIQMYRIQGKTVKEIADIFNCSMSTVNRTLREERIK